jgi:hypothetical protein
MFGKKKEPKETRQQKFEKLLDATTTNVKTIRVLIEEANKQLQEMQLKRNLGR